jgi:4,5:9,10-diseco-3-hydroxy-5,9,17-trioxoandrosta-1(10),2-diene-4-oate hydrolase
MTVAAVPEANYCALSNGYRIHYHEAGSGPPVVFLHGSGPGATGWSNFRGNYPHFAEGGFRCIVPDTLGYGYSSKPEDVKYTVPFLVEVLQSFLTEIGVDRCTVIGNSMGGAMAMQFALDHPSMVDKLVLMAPGGLEERETYMAMSGIQTMIKSIYGKAGITRDGMKKVFSLQLYDESLITDEIIDQRFQIAETQPMVVFSSLRVPNLAERLSELTCPVLGLWGVNDNFCPVSGADRIAKNCADARVMTINRCGHWVMVEHRDVFNRLVLDFLQNG